MSLSAEALRGRTRIILALVSLLTLGCDSTSGYSPEQAQRRGICQRTERRVVNVNTAAGVMTFVADVCTDVR